MRFKLRSDSRCGVLGLALAFMFLAGCGQSDSTMNLEPEKIKKIEQGHIDAAKSGAFGDPTAKKVGRGAR
jgi:nitrous oxide reductase accessory protein NosL